MNERIESYCDLLSRFLDGSLEVPEFQRAYLEKFKNEENRFSEEIFNLLDTLFGDVDAFTDNQELLLENPRFYVDERSLRESVVQAQSGLHAILHRG